MKLKLLDRLKLVEESETFETFLAVIDVPHFMKVSPIKKQVDNMGFNIDIPINQIEYQRVHSYKIYTTFSVAPKIPCKNWGELHRTENQLLRLIGDEASVYYSEIDPLYLELGSVGMVEPILKHRDYKIYHKLKFLLFPSIPPEGQEEKGRIGRFLHGLKPNFSEWYKWKEVSEY